MPYQNIKYALKLCEYTHIALPDFPLQYLRCLIYVYYNEGSTISNLSKKMDIPLSSASRILSALENKRQYGEGYHLVQILRNPSNRRQKIISLSKKGKEFLYELDKAMM